MPQPEFEIIQRVLAGETAALDVPVRQYQQGIYRLTYRRARNGEDVKDLAQEAFAQTYRSLGTLRRLPPEVRRRIRENGETDRGVRGPGCSRTAEESNCQTPLP